MPRISVIVPVYKVEDYLHRCVQSILSQTLKDLEVILVDDGSPDGCGVICEEFAAKDSRVKVIHKENGGLSDARNAGLDMATGDYIGFVDSDDHIRPTMYQRLLQALEENGADMSLCNYAYVDGQDRVDGTMRCSMESGVLSRSAALERLDTASPDYSFYVTAWNKLYKRSLFDSLRFPVGKLHEDEFVAHHIFDRCRCIAVVGEELYRYVQRSGSIMRGGVSVRSLDGVYALYDRYEFYLAQKMLLQAKEVLSSATWKLSTLLGQLPREAKKEAARAVRLLMPAALRKRWKSALLLSVRWLRYLQRSVVAEARHRRCLRRYEKACPESILLLDTPEHENIGDHAIALAQLQLLREACPGRAVCEVTAQQLDGQEAEFAALTPAGKTLFIPGGGFLGCLWPLEEERFRRIVKAFHRQRLVVFPQTVTFDLSTGEGREYLRQSQQIYGAHPDLTVFVREEKSLEFLQTHFPGVRTYLVPDTVLLLEAELPRLAREGVILCLRGDLEKKLTEEDHAAIRQALADVFPRWPVKSTDTVAAHAIAPGKRQRAVWEKLKEFASARLVVTDRLHGMVFAALTATPCIALGNSNGKVRGVYRWLEGLGYVYYLEDVQQLEKTLCTLKPDRGFRYRREELAEKFEPLRSIAAEQ